MTGARTDRTRTVPVKRQIPLLLLLLCAAAPRLAAQEPTVPEPTAVSSDTAAISPRGALVRSLVLPGWGQSYVGAPGRGAVYFGLEAGSLWMVFKSRQQLRAARSLERFMRDSGTLDADDRLDLVRSRENQLEDWITLSIFFLVFSGADAYVAAQLADFDERFGVRPTTGGGVELEARVPIGPR